MHTITYMVSLILCTFIAIQSILFLGSIFVFSKHIPKFKTIRYAIFTGVLFVLIPEAILNFLETAPFQITLNEALSIALSVVSISAILFGFVIYSIFFNRISNQ